MKYQVKQIANIRLSPGYSNKDSWDVVGSVQVGEIVESLGSPTTSDGLIWHQTNKGWIAESAPDRSIILAEQNLVLSSPVDRHIPITQEFGENPAFYSTIPGYPVPLKGHNGMDFGTPVGSPIYSVDAGVVMFAGFDLTGFGNLVRIKHEWGESLYAHLDQIYVQLNQTVSAGIAIAASGQSGLGSGPHLHFGLRIYPYDRADGWGGYTNPRGYLNV